MLVDEGAGSRTGDRPQAGISSHLSVLALETKGLF